ncbi:hypothetical protein Y032_0048g1556 [Ancylostoma ceylanicum]|uniref:Uncharacterized protein n=1 Tax=Ancylostoma ceylanicum TaxID=53326 RepID=A0A016UA24_9BILA|nr:hypothetical protein Y032_0048g1556 [Ancylostoma ceylanicum]
MGNKDPQVQDNHNDDDHWPGTQPECNTRKTMQIEKSHNMAEKKGVITITGCKCAVRSILANIEHNIQGYIYTAKTIAIPKRHII